MEERFLRGGAVYAEPERHEHTLLRMVGKGLLRLAGLLSVAAAVTAGAGFALVSGGRRVHYRGELGEDLGTGGGSIDEGMLLILAAFFLLGLGVLVESQT